MHHEVQYWQKAFLQKHGDFNLQSLDGSKCEIAEIITSISALPFLAEKRLIFIHHLPEAAAKKETPEREPAKKPADPLQKLIDALPGIPETSIVVFIQPQ